MKTPGHFSTAINRKRSYRQGTAFNRAKFAVAVQIRTATTLADTRDHRDHLLFATGRMRLAASARQLFAMAHSLPMVCILHDDGIFESFNPHLVQIDRVRTGREPVP